MSKLRQEENARAARRDKILAPPPFCQELSELSGGISVWPAPRLRSRRRSPAQAEAVAAARLESRK
ncbi:hypothetical protein IY145_09635 [Methylosinus sp. H3A]|uniref:hypothetical protein n=1 Tax=Methylosinus sp. H3A TaxID=2785786 RepID=UPI0018C25D0B|nr:hypothetical protein [Methylosinus sp. H3A]MBG0809640.1 hypothetical protein [Methylosinus sp. H3A]